MPNQLAYGFVSLEEVFGRRLNELNAGVVDTAVQASLAEHNRQVNSLLALTTGRTTLAQERFYLPGAGTLQPLDEWGNPKPVRGGPFADVGFPIQGGGSAWGTNIVSEELMTVQEANNYQVQIQQQDADWIRRHILAALLDNTSWTYNDEEVGAVTVLPLANGDTQTYLTRNGLMATANHYVAQAAAIADATNPFDNVHTLLTRYPGNDGPFVSYVASNLVADIEALENFVPVVDTDIIVGANNDRLGGVPASVRAFGEEVLGKVDQMWIVEWGTMPDDYILSLAQGSAEPALVMREYPAASLQGLFQRNHSPDGNRMLRAFRRFAGFGARNRTAAAVTFVEAGDTTYDIPTGFATPLPV